VKTQPAASEVAKHRQDDPRCLIMIVAGVVANHSGIGERIGRQKPIVGLDRIGTPPLISTDWGPLLKSSSLIANVAATPHFSSLQAQGHWRYCPWP